MSQVNLRRLHAPCTDLTFCNTALDARDDDANEYLKCWMLREILKSEMTIIETYFDDEDECLGCWVLRKTPHKGEVNWTEVEPHTKHSLQLLNCTNHTNYKWRLTLCSILYQLKHLSAATHTAVLFCAIDLKQKSSVVEHFVPVVSVFPHTRHVVVFIAVNYSTLHICAKEFVACVVYFNTLL